MSELVMDQFLPPLECCFVDCHDLWIKEVRKRIVTEAEIREIRFTENSKNDSSISETDRGSVLVFQSNLAELERDLRLVHGWFRKKALVLVVGDPPILAFAAAFRAAGAVTVVTDIFGCDRLATIIEKSVGQRREILTDWRTRFVNRIPWKTV